MEKLIFQLQNTKRDIYIQIYISINLYLYKKDIVIKQKFYIEKLYLYIFLMKLNNKY